MLPGKTQETPKLLRTKCQMAAAMQHTHNEGRDD
jgi:hypothetical protein